MIEFLKIEEIEKNINYFFTNKENLILALTHSSFANEHKKSLKSNERLEFLGDAILNFTIAEFIFKEYPNLPEGEMTKYRANIVCESSLVICANNLHLGEYILLGRGERKNGGKNRTSILSDAFEALVGAIYIDSGIDRVRIFIKDQLSTIIENSINGVIFMDYKTRLQEIIQRTGDHRIIYDIISEIGPDHNKSFRVQVVVGNDVLGYGQGKNKKEAEQQAAKEALEKRWLWE